MLDLPKAMFLCVLLVASTAAQAQVGEGNAGTALKLACQADYRAHCTGRDPAPPIAAACLAQFYVNLSRNCQTALDAYNAPASQTPEE